MSRRLLAAFAVLLLIAGASGAAETDRAMDLARRTLAFVQLSAARPELAKDLDALAKRIETAKLLGDRGEAELIAQIRDLRRRIILSHPLLGFERILVNLRSCQVPGHMCDQYLGRHSRPGEGLAVLESWKHDPKLTTLLKGKLPEGMTYHPDLSFDAQRVVFAFCEASEPNRERRGFFLYEAALDGSWVRRITGTPRDPLVGAKARQTVLIEDYDPCYLPGGGFAFISTRSQQYGRCHGSRYVPAYILYRCDADGSNIRQISFNEANEWNPSVLHDGRIVYTRWDYINRHDTNFQSLWVTRPDGAATGHFYGNYSVGPCMIAEAIAIPDSHKVVATATDHHGYTAGSIIVIDPYKGQDGGEPLLCVTPEIGFPERGAPAGTQMAPQPLTPVVQAEMDSRGRRQRPGRAATPWPLSEDLFLVSIQVGGQYGIYLVDTLGGRELIYTSRETSCFSSIPIQPRPEPPAVPSFAAETPPKPTGRFFVENVYQSTQPIERGTIKRLRVSEIISQPTRAKPILSYVNNEIIKRILGTVPVAPDGSVAFEAPVSTPLQFQLLDADGMAVMTMRSLVYLQPGETAGCVGCHEPRDSTPVKTRPAEVTFRELDPPVGPRYEGGLSYMRTVQPVLDRYCIGCHGLGKTEGGVSLLGERSDRFSVSYDSIMKRGGMVRIAQRNGETNYSKPKDYFAHAGKLAGMLRDGHVDRDGKPRVQLDRESFQRIVDWLDLNAQYYGDYSFNRSERQPPASNGEKALRQRVQQLFGAELAAQPFAALVNVALPAASRVLLAPLSAKAGGWEQIRTNGWAGASDAGYQEMLKLVGASITPMDRHDVNGTCGGAEKGCRCGCCWVPQARADRLKPPAEAPKTASRQ